MDEKFTMPSDFVMNFEIFGVPFVGASFSPCRKWRYSLWRIWEPSRPRVAFIGLNPSTADETEDDPTVRRCINYAKTWNFGGMYMFNIFGVRATDPRQMLADDEPVGPYNDDFIIDEISQCQRIVCCWGSHGSHMKRSDEVLEILKSKKLFCFGLNNNGEPKHPLYLKKDLIPVPFVRK